jgi:hypothetical protein
VNDTHEQQSNQDPRSIPERRCLYANPAWHSSTSHNRRKNRIPWRHGARRPHLPNPIDGVLPDGAQIQTPMPPILLLDVPRHGHVRLLPLHERLDAVIGLQGEVNHSPVKPPAAASCGGVAPAGQEDSSHSSSRPRTVVLCTWAQSGDPTAGFAHMGLPAAWRSSRSSDPPLPRHTQKKKQSDSDW